MASVLTCDICFENFSKLNRLPKVLECGHTLCYECLGNLLQTQKSCPTCKATISKPLEEHPTNFIAFRKIEIANRAITSVLVRNLEGLEDFLLVRRELLLKSIGERTSFRNLVTNGITRIQQMLEMDESILNFMDVENLIAGLEAEVEKMDSALYCCSKEDLKPTYSINNYISTPYFLFELANRIHRGEEIYAYEMIPRSKLKYGKITLKEGSINVHALDLPSVGKKSSIVPFQDIRKCITKENFRTFVEIEDQKLSFTVTDSSLLASQFIKLCSGETGCMLKGASGSTPPKIEIPKPVIHQRGVHVMSSMPMKNITQNEFVRIDKYIINDEKSEGFSDYDMTIFTEEKETTCSVGEIIVQMFPNGSVEIQKCITVSETYKNVVAKANKDQISILYGMNPAIIFDCGISLIISK